MFLNQAERKAVRKLQVAFEVFAQGIGAIEAGSDFYRSDEVTYVDGGTWAAWKVFEAREAEVEALRSLVRESLDLADEYSVKLRSDAYDDLMDDLQVLENKFRAVGGS